MPRKDVERPLQLPKQGEANNSQESNETLRAKLVAHEVLATKGINVFGRPLLRSVFRDFYRCKRGEDGLHHGYCSLCGAEEVKTVDDSGRVTRISVTCKSDCPGVVLGLWEQKNHVE